MIDLQDLTTPRSMTRSFALERNAAPVHEDRRADVRHHRCGWAVRSGDSMYLRYHDSEWGVPCHDDRALFEFLLLETARTGLSCSAILRKREAYRRAFAGFEPRKVAAFSPARCEQLLQETGIVRHRKKVEAAVENARRILEVQRERGSFANYLWGFVDGEPVQNKHTRLEDVPSRTLLSDRVSRDMRQRGFRFVGSITVYACLQSAGLVNDHLVGCFRHACVARLAEPSRLASRVN